MSNQQAESWRSFFLMMGMVWTIGAALGLLSVLGLVDRNTLFMIGTLGMVLFALGHIVE